MSRYKPIPETGCPCVDGGSFLFTRNLRCSGWWEQTIEVDHEEGRSTVVNTNLDGVRYGEDPKTVTCAECGKRWLNPNYEDA